MARLTIAEVEFPHDRAALEALLARPEEPEAMFAEGAGGESTLVLSLVSRVSAEDRTGLSDPSNAVLGRDEVGFPLGMYSKSTTVEVPRQRLLRHRFFRSLLSHEWRNHHHVQLGFRKIQLLDAFLVALEALMETEPQRLLITFYNHFEVFAVAEVLELPGLQTVCEKSIVDSLSPGTAIQAIQMAIDTNRPRMLRLCFQWIRRAKPLVDAPYRGEGRSQRAPSRTLYFNQGTMELIWGEHRISANVFRETLEASFAERLHHFETGSFVAPDPDPPLGSEGAGFAGLRRYYVQRRRNQGSNGLETHFVVYPDDGSDNPEVVMAAASTLDAGTFVLSENDHDFDPFGDSCIGVIRSSFLGLQFNLYNHGVSWNDQLMSLAFPTAVRKDYCLINYKSNVMARVPNAMKVLVHATDEIAADPERRTMARCLEADDLTGLRLLRTRKPKWNADLDAWTMDFRGRVKLASKKNFQLIDPEEPDNVLMVFGKVTKTRFTLDLKPPMTVSKALSVALTSFADKMAVT